MKPVLGTLLLALLATFVPSIGSATQSDSFFDIFIEIDGVSIPIDGFSRARNGNRDEGCNRLLTFEVVQENAAYGFYDLLVSSFHEVLIRFRLPNGRSATLRLQGVTVLDFGPAAVDGQKGWRGTFCYEQQVLEFGGQDLE